MVAARSTQEDVVFQRLDAFGMHRHAQRAAQRDDAVDDGRRARPRAKSEHEGLVDLELVERKAPEVTERGKARAEIVERDVHADFLEAAHEFHRRFGIVHQHAFGDFDLQPLWFKAGFAEQFLDPFCQRRPLELHWRDVHRENDAAPWPGLTHGRGNGPLAHLMDQPRLLGDRHEECR